MVQRRPAVAVVWAAVACTAALLAPAAGAATFSDSFAGRETVSVLPAEVTGSNVGATREAGEPPLKPLAPAGHTVWVEWVAPSSGYVTLSTCDSWISTVFGVYVGDQLDGLAEVGSTASHSSPGCAGVHGGITFFAVAGAEFQIALDGNAFLPPFSPPPVTEGSLTLSIEATPPPANDDFADATAIVGETTEEPGGARFYFAVSLGYNWGASKEASEPDHAGDPGGASVWYSWTAPESAPVRVSICCSAAQLIGVYRGASLASLNEVGSGRGQVAFPAVAGTEYEIAVDGELTPVAGGPLEDNFDLVVEVTPSPRGEEPLGPTLPPSGSGRREPPPPWSYPPRTSVRKVRVRQKVRTATFTFESTDELGTFRCRLDGGRWSPCRSPRTYSNVAAGSHAFRVYGIDRRGLADPTPVTSHFSIRPQRHHG